jgi:hypothetical protein
MRLGVHRFVQGARPTVSCILLYAHLSSSALPKQILCVSRHQEEHSNVSPMAVAPSSKHFAGVRKVWVGTSWRPKLGFSPSARPHRGTGKNDYNPCKVFTPRRFQNPARCRSAVETWRMYPCLFQRRAKRWQRVRSRLPCAMLNSIWESPTSRSSSATNTRIK